jgi:uncharacterized protein
MRKAAPLGFTAALGLALIWAPAGGVAASLNCNAATLSRAQMAICLDSQLSRADAQTERRVAALGRRMGFGQYLGMLHWHRGWIAYRDGCQSDRACLTASYRAQSRFLDRLQQCLDNGQQRRACLRNTLNVEREAAQRR